MRAIAPIAGSPTSAARATAGRGRAARARPVRWLANETGPCPTLPPQRWTTPSPRLRGEGWGEGDSPRVRLVESPPHPKPSASTSPRKRGEVTGLTKPSTQNQYTPTPHRLRLLTGPSLR